MRKILILTLLLALALSCSKERPAAQKNGEYVAKINNQTIGVEDVKREFSMLPEEIQQMYMKEEGIDSVVDELVKKELLYQEAKKRSFDKDPRYEGQVREFSKRLMIEFLLREEIEKTAEVTDEEVRRFYEANKESFMRQAPGSSKPELIELERVQDLIKERLVTEKQRKAFEEYIDKLKKTASIDINTEAIKSAFGNSATP